MASTSLLRGTRGCAAGNSGTPCWLATGAAIAGPDLQTGHRPGRTQSYMDLHAARGLVTSCILCNSPSAPVPPSFSHCTKKKWLPFGSRLGPPVVPSPNEPKTKTIRGKVSRSSIHCTCLGSFVSIGSWGAVGAVLWGSNTGTCTQLPTQVLPHGSLPFSPIFTLSRWVSHHDGGEMKSIIMASCIAPRKMGHHVRHMHALRRRGSTVQQIFKSDLHRSQFL